MQAVRIIKEWRVHFVHPLFLLYRRNFSGGKLMSLSVMLQQLASGMVVSVEIFVVTLLFSLPLGLLICPVNAAIDGCVFRTILYFWNPYFHGIQPDRCVYCIQY